jgi:hypothetical protein
MNESHHSRRLSSMLHISSYSQSITDVLLGTQNYDFEYKDANLSNAMKTWIFM